MHNKSLKLMICSPKHITPVHSNPTFSPFQSTWIRKQLKFFILITFNYQQKCSKARQSHDIIAIFLCYLYLFFSSSSNSFCIFFVQFYFSLNFWLWIFYSRRISIKRSIVNWNHGGSHRTTLRHCKIFQKLRCNQNHLWNFIV